MAVKFSNLASSTLSSGINDSVTTVPVASASSFPSLSGSDYFYLSLGIGAGSEVVKVTGVSGTNLTVVRGQDGTTAAAWTSGTTIALRVVAAALDDISSLASTAADTESVSISGDTMTGALKLPNGSEGAPSYAFSGQASSGMYLLGTSQLGLSVSSSRKFRLLTTRAYFDNLSSGVYVGGPLEASGTLTVPTMKTTASGQHYLLNTTGAGQNAYITYQDNSANKWEHGKNTLDKFFVYSYALGDTVLTLQNDGKVGIRQTTPTEALHIKTRGAPASIRLEQFDTSGAPGNNDVIGSIDWSINDDGTFSGADTVRARIQAVVENTSSGTGLRFFSGNTSVATPVERMRIIPDGKVGIGTASPSGLLHLVDGAGTVPTLGGGTNFIIQNNDTTSDVARLNVIGGAAGYSTLHFGDAAAYNVGGVIYNHSTNTMTLDAGGTTGIAIDSSGRVGIGITAPDSHVNLHIQDSAYAFLALEATASGGRQYELFSYAADESFHIYDRNADAYRLSIDETGKVGIGTTSPADELELKGDGYRFRVSSADQMIASLGNWGNSGADIDEGYLSLYSSGTEAIRIASNAGSYFNGGIVSIGHTASITQEVVQSGSTISSWTPDLQVNKSANGGVAISQWNTGNTASANLWLTKSSNATVGTHGSLDTDEAIGRIIFSASDGSTFTNSASIEAFADAGQGSNDTPGRLEFKTTADGTAAPTTRMTIDHAGDVSMTVGTGNTGLSMIPSAAGSTSIILNTFADNAAGRNWAFRNRYNAHGLLEVMRSTSNSAAPLTPVMTFSGSDGTVSIPGATNLQGATDQTGVLRTNSTVSISGGSGWFAPSASLHVRQSSADDNDTGLIVETTDDGERTRIVLKSGSSVGDGLISLNYYGFSMGYVGDEQIINIGRGSKYVGIGMGNTQPAHLLDIKGASGTSPLLQITNSDTEDNDTGRESTIRFSGYRSGGEAVINGQITGTHDGSADDDKGMLTFFTNAGSGIAEKFRIGAAGQLGVGGANYGTDGQVLTSTGATTAPAWEDAGAASNYWTLSSGNVYRSSGLVGIGLSSAPKTLLQISGTPVTTGGGDVASVLTLMNTASAADGNKVGITFSTNSGGTANAFITAEQDGSNHGTLHFGGYDGNANRATVLSIDAGANVATFAGQIIADDSTDAGAPVYSFTGDADTGFFREGANTIGISTGGTRRWSISGSSMTSQITGGARITQANGSPGAPNFTFNDDSNTGMYRVAADKLGFTTGGTFRAVIDGDGDFGIGTASPTSRLHIYEDDSSFGNTQLHIENDKTDDAAVLRIEGKRTSLNDTAQILFANNGSLGSAIKAYSAGQDGDLRFYTSGASSGDTLNEMLRLDNNGLLSFKASGNAQGINFEQGNSRIYFGGIRAIEGSTASSGNLELGEGYSGKVQTHSDAGFNVADGSLQVGGTEVISSSRAATFVGINSTSGTVQFTDGGSTFDSSNANGYPVFSQTNGSAQIGFARAGGSTGLGYIGADVNNVFAVFDSSFVKHFIVTQGGTVNIPTGALQMGGTQIIDASRNMSNMGNITGAWLYTGGITATAASTLSTVLISGVSNYTGLEVKGAGGSRPQVKFSNVNDGVIGQIYGTEANALVIATGTGGAAALTLDSSQQATFGNHIVLPTVSSTAGQLRGNIGGLELQSNRSGDMGILGTFNNGTFGFQLYAHSTGYGFLDGVWSSWDIKKVPDGNLYLNDDNTHYLNPPSTSIMNRIDANIYYDKGNTGYYVDPASTSTLYRVLFNEHLVGQTAGGYVQTQGSSGNLWAIGSGGGTSAPGTASTTFGIHNYNGSAWSNPVVILNNGNFLIGDDVDSTFRLHVRKNDATRANIARFENNTNGGDSKVVIAAQANQSGDPYLYFDAGGQDFAIGELWTSGANKMTIGKAIPSAFGAGDGIVIDQSGNVGIGTTSPAYPIHVESSVAGDWMGKIKNTHATNGNGLLIHAGDDASVKALHVGSYNGTGQYLVVRGDGNVGIGTDGPAQKFHVAAGYIHADAGYGITWDNTHERIEQSDGKLEFFTNNGEAMTLSGSNLGIGTTSPGYPIHVESSVAGDWMGKIKNTHATNGYGLLIHAGDDASVKALSVGNYAGTGDYLVVRGDGNVGIGATSPGYKLHVTGTIGVFTGGDALLYLGEGESGGSYSKIYWKSSDDTLRLGTQAGGDTVVINESGNVGIGATNPGTKLDVSTVANVAGIRVVAPNTTGQSYGVTIAAGSNASDYAFNINNAAGTGLVRVRGDGNVGIGETAPWAKLHVNKGGGSGVNDADDTLLLSDSDYVSFMMEHYNAASGSRNVRFRNNAGVVTVERMNDAATTLTSTTMTIDTPNGRVHVIGSGTTINNANTGELQIGAGLASAGSAGSVQRLAMQPYAHTGGPWTFTARDTSSKAYLDIGYGAGPDVTFTSDGSVGINDTTPEFPLTIGITSSTTQQVGLEVTQATSGNDGRIRFKNTADSNYVRMGMESNGTFFVEPYTGSQYLKVLKITKVGVMTLTGNESHFYRGSNDVGTGHEMYWTGSNYAGSMIDYAMIKNSIVSRTNGAESADLIFKVKNAGSFTQPMTIKYDGNVEMSEGLTVGDGLTVNGAGGVVYYEQGQGAPAINSDNTVGALVLKDKDNNWEGTLYATSTEFGFLNGEWASWDQRKVKAGNLYLNNNNSYYMNPGVTSIFNDLRANIVYDQNNTAYHSDPSATTTLSTLNVNATATFNSTFTISNSASDVKISLQGTNDPLIHWKEGTTDRFYIQWRAGYNAPIYVNQESNTHEFYGTGGSTALRFKSDNETIRGYVYTDTSGMGFLDKDGQWAFYHVHDQYTRFSVNNGGHCYAYSSSFRAPIFYDSDNTAYYIDGAGTSVFNTLRANTTFGVNTTSSTHVSTTKIQAIASSGAPATGSTTQGNSALCLEGQPGIRLDIGSNYSWGSTHWFQTGNKTDLSARYGISLNPMGGSVTVGLAATPPSTSSYRFYVQNSSHNQPGALVESTHAGQSASELLTLRYAPGSPNNTAAKYLTCYDDDSEGTLHIYSNGNVVNTNDSYGGLSDLKLKQDVADASSQWDDVKALRLRKFRFKHAVAEDPDAPYMLGLIAQETELISPNLVVDTEDLEDVEVELEDGSTEMRRLPNGETTKELKYSILHTKAFGALQEAMARIEELEAKVASLEEAS